MTDLYIQPDEPSYVSIETEPYGTLLLRSSLLVRDATYFQSIKDESSARDFAVQVVYRNLVSPELEIEEIESWNDNLLALVTHTWARQKSDPVWMISDNLPPFEALVQGFENYLTNFYAGIFNQISKIYMPSFEGFFEGVQKQLQQSINIVAQAANQQADTYLNIIQQSLTLFAESIFEPFYQNIASIIADPIRFNFNFDIGSFFDNLPDFTQIAERFKAYDKAADALEEGGFSFLLSHWTLSDIARFVGLSSVPPRVRSAATTNRLLALTRSDDFATQLEHLFSNSSILKRRFKILEQAILAHKNRQYILSIPVLLAQVEGIFTDALVLKELVVRIKGKLYAKDSTGVPKLNRKGKFIQLRGLGQKIQNSDLQDEDILQGLAKFFVDYLVPERNGILHGNLTNYAKAKLSVQLLLNIYLLAIEFNYFENETIP